MFQSLELIEMLYFNLNLPPVHWILSPPQGHKYRQWGQCSHSGAHVGGVVSKESTLLIAKLFRKQVFNFNIMIERHWYLNSNYVTNSCVTITISYIL